MVERTCRWSNSTLEKIYRPIDRTRPTSPTVRPTMRDQRPFYCLNLLFYKVYVLNWNKFILSHNSSRFSNAILRKTFLGNVKNKIIKRNANDHLTPKGQMAF